MRLIIFLMVIWVTSCNTTNHIQYLRTGEVLCDGYKGSTITVKSTSRASTTSEAINFAEKNALENILFKGIPDCNQQIAMINDESEFKMKNNSAYESFLNTEYVKYITQSENISTDKSNNAAFVTQRITIDIAALRKALENKGWIRKFGF